MDRVGASYERTIDSIRSRLKGNPVAVQVPMGAEDEFRGVVDLIEGQAIMYSDGRDDVGEPPELIPVPAEYEKTYHDYRHEMIEKIVETDETLLIKYLEGEDICADDLRSALRNATINRQLVPVLCGSAMRGKGIDPLLDAIICYLPSPLDVPAVEGTVPGTETVAIREPLDSEPLAALAFKVVVDPTWAAWCSCGFTPAR